MMVKVFGTVSGGLFTVERLVTAPEMRGSTGQRVQAGGVITRFNTTPILTSTALQQPPTQEPSSSTATPVIWP